jgi:tripartite-type tricarboxylate transporter receptor subunit TctC
MVMALCLPFAGVGGAQDYPNRAIQMIVPNAAGTNGDILGRLMAAEMAKVLGQPVVVINKPGADSIVGFEYVAKQAPADGYTIVVTSVSNLSILPSIVKDLRFDPLKDLPPFMGFATSRFVFASPVTKPWKNMAELVTYAKTNPGKLNYGTASANIRLGSEAVISNYGLAMERISYPSGGPYLLAIARGEIDMGFLGEQQANDKVRVLAVSGTKRAPAFPDAPTYAELGMPPLPGIDYSLNARAGTPKEAIAKLHAAAQFAIRQPGLIERLNKAQWDVVERGPEEEAKNLAAQGALFAAIAKSAGVEPQ